MGLFRNKANQAARRERKAERQQNKYNLKLAKQSTKQTAYANGIDPNASTWQGITGVVGGIVGGLSGGLGNIGGGSAIPDFLRPDPATEKKPMDMVTIAMYGIGAFVVLKLLKVF